MRGLSLMFSLSVLAVGCGPISSASDSRSSDPLARVTAEDLYAKGEAFATLGDFVRAEQYLVAAQKRGYPQIEVLPLLMDVCIKDHRYDAALFYGEPLLREEPGNWRLRFVVASLHVALGRKIKAQAELERVILDAPEAPEPKYSLGELLWDGPNRNHAAPYFEHYLKLAPEGKHAEEAVVFLRLAKAEQPGDDSRVPSVPGEVSASGVLEKKGAGNSETERPGPIRRNVDSL